MSHWQSTLIVYGARKENSTVTMIFRALETIPEIKTFQGSCGCTNFKYNPDKRELFVKLSLGNIPPQVQGNMDIHKTITVFYMDETSEVLHIKGIITK